MKNLTPAHLRVLEFYLPPVKDDMKLGKLMHVKISQVKQTYYNKIDSKLSCTTFYFISFQQNRI